MNVSIRRAAVAALAGASAFAVASAVAPAALADRGTPGQRETVCADTLAVRTDSNAWQGYLYRGETFRVDRVDGHWAYGFAYGRVNHKGKVEDGWFC
ncbi:hypothetical protein OHR68_33860 [Spirillospora sp. NBC_00431]